MAKKAKKRHARAKPAADVASLKREIRKLRESLVAVMPLHMSASSSVAVTEVQRVGLAASKDSPAVLFAWVEDELVLKPGTRTGQSRPRPVNEVITLTVQVAGEPGQNFSIVLTHTDRDSYADRIPPDNVNYEGSSRYTVEA